MWLRSEYQHAKSRTQHFHSATTEHNFSYLLNQLTIGLPEPPQTAHYIKKVTQETEIKRRQLHKRVVHEEYRQEG